MFFDLDEEVLEHYGVKGMKWGQHKRGDRDTRPGKRQTEPNSSDASRAGGITSRARSQKSTRHLSNEELEAAIKRMRLEQEFSKLSKGADKTKVQKGVSFVSKLLSDQGKQAVNQQAQAGVRNVVTNVGKKAAGVG
jgi:hypothetical protein